MKAERNGQFPLDGDDEVGKSGRRAAVEGVKTRRYAGQHFGALRDAETQPRLRSADNIGPLTDGPVDAVLRLQTPIWNDLARISDVGAVRENLGGAGGTPVGCKSL